MREGVRNFLLGVATIAACVGLAVLLMRFGELDPLFHPRYAITIHTVNASGLRVGSGVEYNGVPVGSITNIHAEPDPQFPVRIVAMIDQKISIPNDSVPRSATSLLGGSAKLELARPANAPAEVLFFATDGTAAIRSAMSGGMFDSISSQLDQRMQPLMAALENFNRLSATYIELGDNLNALVAPSATQPGESATDLRSAIAKANQVLEDIQESLSIARQWLDDEQMRADAKNAIANASSLIDRASTAVDRYTQLADSLQTNSTDLARRLTAVADQLGATLDDVRRVARLAADGDGTIGSLLKRPDLYNSLNDAAIRLERALTDAQLLIQKIKSEGLDINW